MSAATKRPGSPRALGARSNELGLGSGWPFSAELVRVVSGAAFPLLLVGCGAGTPLMHPAHVLGRNEIRAAAGASQEVVLGPTEAAIEESRILGEEPNGIPVEDRDAFVEGAVAQTISTPGLAPFVAVRAGLGGENEMGLTYTGSRVRGDLRHAFLFDDDVALSVGGGVGAILPSVGSQSPRTGSGAPAEPEGNEIGRYDGGSVSGWTLDVPVLLGIRTRPDVVSGWVGGRVLYERYAADLVFDFESDAPLASAEADGSRFYAGAVAGLCIGFPPVRVVLELSGGYQVLDADVRSGNVTYRPEVGGLVLTPAFALAADFN